MKNKIFNLLRFCATTVLLASFMTGCYPGGADYTEDMDIVMTIYNPEYNFTELQTYFMPDSIIHIVDEGEEDDVNRKYDGLILSEFEKNMESRGFVRLDSICSDTTNCDPAYLPDVVVFPALLVSKNTSIYYYPWYPYWGGGGYYPGWGWGGGWGWYYPPGMATASTYYIGTIAFAMVDPDRSDVENETFFVAWNATFRGLAGTSTSATNQRITTAIKQAFKQSPYLKKQ